MSLFSGPEEHAANPPSTWEVHKAIDRVWHLRLKDGAVLDTFTTRRAAVEARTSSFWTRQYEKDGRWYAGETPPGHRSWAECKADRDRAAAKQAEVH